MLRSGLKRRFSPERSSQQTGQGDDTSPRPNHALILDEVKRYVSNQNSQMDNQETRASLIAGIATALVAGVFALFSSASSSPRREIQHTVAGATFSNHAVLIVLLVASFASFALVAFGLIQIMRFRPWQSVPDPTTLVAEYWSGTADRTIADLAATMAKAAADNQVMLGDKMRWVGRSSIFLGIEVLVQFLAIGGGLWSGLL